MNATHIFTNKIDCNDEPHFLYGMKVEVVERYGMSQAGFDCAIRIHEPVEKIAKALGLSVKGLSKEGLIRYLGDIAPEQEGIVVEANEKKDLTLIMP